MSFTSKRVLLTGHTGFKGSWLAIWLDRLGADVYGYALPPKTDRDNFVTSGGRGNSSITMLATCETVPASWTTAMKSNRILLSISQPNHWYWPRTTNLTRLLRPT